MKKIYNNLQSLSFLLNHRYSDIFTVCTEFVNSRMVDMKKNGFYVHLEIYKKKEKKDFLESVYSSTWLERAQPEGVESWELEAIVSKVEVSYGLLCVGNKSGVGVDLLTESETRLIDGAKSKAYVVDMYTYKGIQSNLGWSVREKYCTRKVLLN